MGESGELCTFTLNYNILFIIVERFIGNIDAKADAKGRIVIPASFRKILQSTGDLHLILRKDVFQDCLVLYPKNIWEEELTQLRTRLNKWDEEQQMLFRQFVLDAELLEPDSNGRILIPRRYMQLAEINNEVRFVGMDRTIEIWSRTKLDAVIANDMDSFRKNVKKFLGNPPENV